MKKILFVFGMLALLLGAAVFAQPAPSEITEVTGLLVVTQNSTQDGTAGDSLTAGLVIPIINASGLSKEESDTLTQLIRQKCSDATDYRTCFDNEAKTKVGAYSLQYITVKNASIGFSYYNPGSKFIPITACGANGIVSANTEVTKDELGIGKIFYYASCTVPKDIYKGARIRVRIDYLDSGNVVEIDGKKYIVTVPSRELEVADSDSKIIDTIYRTIRDSITAVAGSSTGQPICIGLIAILGMLLASMYFSGKSPITLLDITTPKLPSPKGFAASGQVLLPYGYGEMNKGITAKLGATSAAVGATALGIMNDMRYTPEGRKVASDLANLKGGSGDPQGKKIVEGLAAIAMKSGMTYSQIKHLLKKLPSAYGSEEHKTVAEIFAKGMAMGGKMAAATETTKQYLLALRTAQTMDVLSGHPDMGVKNSLHGKVKMRLAQFAGANRYSAASTMVVGSYESVIRSGRIVAKGYKEMIKTAPELARGLARITVQTVGGAQALKRMEKASTGKGAMAVLAKQVMKPASAGMEIGKKVAIDQKMAAAYESLKDEVKKDQLKYVLKQLYKAMGVNFAMSEKEMLEFAMKDINILEKCGYLKNAAKIEAVEKELLKILGGSMTLDAKLAGILDIAKRNGAVIDSEMMKFSEKLNNIEKMYGKEDGFLKFLALRELLAEHEKQAPAAKMNETRNDNSFYTVIGRSSVNGSDIWETMVLRTMIWDGENGFLKGGVKEGTQRAWLDTLNRLVGLNPTSNLGELPEFLRNKSELTKIEARMKSTILNDLATDAGRKTYANLLVAARADAKTDKTITNPEMKALTDLLYGMGRLPKTGDVVKGDRLGRTAYWENAEHYGPAADSFKVDMKRHWVGALSARESFAIGEWVENRFSRSNIPPLKASIEAELDKMQGTAKWTIDQRTAMAKKLWVVDQMKQDCEQRFNSQFSQDAYGKMPERSNFYNAILLGFYEKAIQDKVGMNNHPDLTFIKTANFSDPGVMRKFREDIAVKYRGEFNAELKRPVTFNDLLNSPKALVGLYEGDWCYYHKGMPLSVADKVHGEVAMRDNKGQFRKFVAEDVVIDFNKAGKPALQQEFYKLREKGQAGPDWDVFIENVKKWTREDGYKYDREQVFAALVSTYGRNTGDYMKYWKDTAVTIKPMKETMDIAPQSLRMFGTDNGMMRNAMTVMRNVKTELGSYFVKTTLASSWPVTTALYESVPTSNYLKDQSWRLAADLHTNKWDHYKEMNAAERSAYREVEMSHHAYHHAWTWAVDRHPGRATLSQGLLSITESAFHHGPGHLLGDNVPKDYIRGTMSGGEYAVFMAFYGWPMQLASKLHKPYVNTFRSIQTSMQGGPSRWDQVSDSLKPFEYSSPRILEAARSASNILGGGMLSKLRLWENSAEQRQTAGEDLMQGLRQAPSDIFFRRTGVDSIARTGMSNPGASYSDYRYTQKMDEAMAGYMWRNRDAVYEFDKEIRDSAMRSTVRRTVSAEALALRNDQEMRGFGVSQNTIYGWFNPILFAWHMPLPAMPSSITPREFVTRYANKEKYGQSESWSHRVENIAKDVYDSAGRAATPWKGSMVVSCPKCGTFTFRGARCNCGASVYSGKKAA
ncbi:MAG: hypothetical protein V1492_04105 [Candidatus Micrarchaeota archaeon]